MSIAERLAIRCFEAVRVLAGLSGLNPHWGSLIGSGCDVFAGEKHWRTTTALADEEMQSAEGQPCHQLPQGLVQTNLITIVGFQNRPGPGTFKGQNATPGRWRYHRGSQSIGSGWYVSWREFRIGFRTGG